MGGYDKTSGVQLDKLTEAFVAELSMDDIIKINEAIPLVNSDGTIYNDLLRYDTIKNRF